MWFGVLGLWLLGATLAAVYGKILMDEDTSSIGRGAAGFVAVVGGGLCLVAGTVLAGLVTSRERLRAVKDPPD